MTSIGPRPIDMSHPVFMTAATEGSDMSASGIAVTRIRDCFGIGRTLRVLVDNREAARVRYSRRAVIALPPGVHSVAVRMDWCRSKPFDVEVPPGEVVELVAGLRLRGIRWCMSLVAPSRLFIVAPAADSTEKPLAPEFVFIAGWVLSFLGAVALLGRVFG
jgi:hypothetical protein